MKLQCVEMSTGEVALFANHQLITDSDSGIRPGLVRQIGERLSNAVGCQLISLSLKPPVAEWLWEDIMDQLQAPPPPAPTVCAKCGSHLIGELCSAATCPYSDFPQRVDAEDFTGLLAHEIAAKYGVVRASAVAGDDEMTVSFDAAPWLATAPDSSLIDLIEAGWRQCEAAREIPYAMLTTPQIQNLLSHVQTAADEDRSVPISVTLNEQDAMAWLRRQRYGLWARTQCEAADVQLVQASEPEIEGRWDWLDTIGNASDCSFESADQAAADAVRRLALDPEPPVSPLFLGYWSRDAFFCPNGDDQYALVGPTAFCDALGYSREDIAAIGELPVGGRWVSAEYGNFHHVERVL